jgi:uncharacterized protein YndB with AHSA1/START domain
MTSITLVRRIAARPSIVFDALATAEGMAAWWGPDELPVISAEADARLGGAYRVRFRTADGQEHEAFGEYLEMVRPERLVLSWRYAAGGEPEELDRTSRVEFELRAVEGGTELTLTHADLRNAVSQTSHERGWAGALVKLVWRYAETPDATGPA